MMRFSLNKLQSNGVLFLVVAAAAAFMLLVPIGEDVAFDSLKGKGQLRYFRNGMDRVLSLPLRFKDPSKAVLPPLPEFSWDDIFLSRGFRTNLQALYAADGFPRTRHRFFAGYIAVSMLRGIRSRSFYFNWQYNSRDFTHHKAEIIFTAATRDFCRQLQKRGIEARPDKPLTMRRAGYPHLIVSVGLIKARHIFIPLFFYFLLFYLPLFRTQKKNRRWGILLRPLPLVATIALFFLYFIPGMRPFVYALIIGLSLQALLLPCHPEKKIHWQAFTAPLKAFLLSLPLLLLVYLVQIERLTAPAFHDTSSQETLVFQPVRLLTEGKPVSHWPFPPAGLAESTLFQKRILQQEKGKQPTHILRMILANPLYRCRLVRGGAPGLPNDAKLYFVMECSRKMLSEASGKKVDTTYLLNLFHFYRDNFERFLIRENRRISPLGPPVLREDLPEVPLPLRRRAITAFSLFILFSALWMGAVRKKNAG